MENAKTRLKMIQRRKDFRVYFLRRAFASFIQNLSRIFVPIFYVLIK